MISIHAPHTGRDTPEVQVLLRVLTFQSTRPIRGATIHSDTRAVRAKGISIHAPHTGRDYDTREYPPILVLFQSTRPIRGATAKMHNLCSAFLQQQTIKA